MAEMNKLVSIICTTYNEEKLISKTLESFIAQEKPDFEIEILVVDGMSEDKTRDIVKFYCDKYSFIRLIDNPDRKNPFGRNIGVKNAKGDYIALLGAHTIYRCDYIKVCLEEIADKNAPGVSGKVITSADENSSEGKLVELMLTSKFGVSGSSFRTAAEGYTSMINFPVFKKEVFEKIGLYDTSLIRNQDNDFNMRAEKAGFKLYNTWKTECYYYPGDTIKETLAYAHRNGFWNAKSLLNGSMEFYHYVPFIFVMTLLILFIAGIFNFTFAKLFVILTLLHLFTGFIFALQIKKYKTIKNILSLPFLFFAFHFSYGWGTLKGFFLKKV
jgi:glycosyltransferase involved in cell wall biosynthesis